MDDEQPPAAGGAGRLARVPLDDVGVSEFRRYGSARQLYNFKVDNAAAY